MSRHRQAARAEQSSISGVKKRSITKSKRCKLDLSVGRIHRMIKERGYCERVSEYAPIMVTGALECLLVEILTAAGNAARNNDRKRISAEHIRKGIENDKDLNDTVGHMIIPQTEGKTIIHFPIYPTFKSKRYRKKVKKEHVADDLHDAMDELDINEDD